jgi:hypothetical protein
LDREPMLTCLFGGGAAIVGLPGFFVRRTHIEMIPKYTKYFQLCA